jgi:hypothetical protein
MEFVHSTIAYLTLGTLRLLSVVNCKFPRSDQQNKWNIYDLERFSALSPRAMRAAMTGSEYVPDGAAIDDAVFRICQTIESAIHFCITAEIPNCGSSEFPWLHELPAFVSYLSFDCREEIQSGFKKGLFTAKNNHFQSALLLALQPEKALRSTETNGYVGRLSRLPIPREDLPGGDAQSQFVDYKLTQRRDFVSRLGEEEVAFPNPGPSNNIERSTSALIFDKPMTTTPDHVSDATTSPADGDAARGDPEITAIPERPAEVDWSARRRGKARRATRMNPLLVHGTSLHVDLSSPTLMPHLVTDGAQSAVPLDVLAQAAVQPPLKSMQIDVVSSVGVLIRVPVTPSFRTSSLKNAFVTVGDVLMAVHSTLQTPATGFDWTRLSTSQRITVAAAHDVRCSLYGLPSVLEPVKRIDLLDYKTLFAGLVSSEGEDSFAHMELLLRPGSAFTSRLHNIPPLEGSAIQTIASVDHPAHEQS